MPVGASCPFEPLLLGRAIAMDARKWGFSVDMSGRQRKTACDVRGVVTMQDLKVDEALKGLDEGKRKVLLRLVKGGAFVAPLVASFAMKGISVTPAMAMAANSTAP
jgi:hypothetical protein